MFQKKWLVISFLILLAAIAVGFLAHGARALYYYNRFSNPVEATIQQWSLREEKNGEYHLVATFIFEYQRVQKEVITALPRVYPNRWAAEKALEQRLKEGYVQQAWMDPRRPQHAVLVRIFPWKKLLSAAAVLFLLGYFFVLVLYVKRQQQLR